MRMLQSGKEDTLFAKVIIDIAHGAVDRAFTYHVPEALPLLPGHHVTLPFGNGNKTTEGFVLSLMEKSDLKEGHNLQGRISHSGAIPSADP